MDNHLTKSLGNVARQVKTAWFAKPILGAVLVSCVVAATSTAAAEANKEVRLQSLPADTEFDLVILGGRVMDPETDFDAVRNVGIKDGKIGLITEEDISGKDTIDAAGLVVAPGFIDTHFHALDGLSVKMGARDGVTTGMDLEIGAIFVDAWYQAKKDAWPMNYGTGISHEGVRLQVHDPEVDLPKWADAPILLGELRAVGCEDGVCGWQDTLSNLDQLNQLLQLVHEGMQQGASA